MTASKRNEKKRSLFLLCLRLSTSVRCLRLKPILTKICYVNLKGREGNQKEQGEVIKKESFFPFEKRNLYRKEMSSPLCERACPTFQMRRDVCEADKCATVGYKCHQYGAPNSTTDCFSWCCVQDDNMIAVVVIILIVVFLLLVGCIVFLICFCCRKKKEKRRGTLNRENLVQKQLELEEEGETDSQSYVRDGRPDSVLIDQDDSQAMSLGLGSTPPPQGGMGGPKGGANPQKDAWGGGSSQSSTPRQQQRPQQHPKAQQYEESVDPHDIPEVIVERPAEDQSLNGSRQSQPGGGGGRANNNNKVNTLNTSAMSAQSNASRQVSPRPSPRPKPSSGLTPRPKPAKTKDEELFAVPDLHVSPGPYDIEIVSSNASPAPMTLDPHSAHHPQQQQQQWPQRAAGGVSPRPSPRPTATPQPPPPPPPPPPPRTASPPHNDALYFHDDEDEDSAFHHPPPSAAAPAKTDKFEESGAYGRGYQPEFNFDDDEDFFS